MAATASHATRRPAAKRVVRAHPAPANPRLSTPIKAAYIAVGTAGLLALALAILGPRRLERRIVRPLASAVIPQAERLWEEARPLRDQIAGLIEAAGPARERLARRLQSWIGHFHAS